MWVCSHAEVTAATPVSGATDTTYLPAQLVLQPRQCLSKARDDERRLPVVEAAGGRVLCERLRRAPSLGGHARVGRLLHDLPSVRRQELHGASAQIIAPVGSQQPVCSSPHHDTVRSAAEAGAETPRSLETHGGVAGSTHRRNIGVAQPSVAGLQLRERPGLAVHRRLRVAPTEGHGHEDAALRRSP